MSWTDEKVSQLAKLWGEGYSASAIGKLIGVSKNAVIGKAHRMHLTSRPSPIKRSQTPRSVVRPVVAPKPVATMMKVPQASSMQTSPMQTSPVQTSSVPAQPVVRAAPRRVAKKADGPACMWPIGDPGQDDFRFCGEPSVPGKPYCAKHCQVAYITKPRNSEAA